MREGEPDTAALEAALGVSLNGCRPTGRGQRRTFFAEQPAGPVVVKWGLDPRLPEKIPYVAAQVPELLARGIPAPAFLAHGPLATGGYAWMQRRMPGDPATALSEGLLDQLLALLDRMRDAPRGRHASDNGWWVSAAVTEDVAGYWAATAALGPRARALCQRLRAWVQAVPQPLARHDFVHIDLNVGNVLVDGGRISGVVDLENLGVGDRTVDVVRLAFEWFWQHRRGTPGLAPDGLGQLVHYGRSSGGEPGWRYAVAHEIISRLGWRGEHAMTVDPLTLVDVCAGFLDACGKRHLTPSEGQVP